MMIEAHVLDRWTRLPSGRRPAFVWAMVLGGFGAPLFLFLAGVSLVLSAESKYRKTGDLDAGVARRCRSAAGRFSASRFLFRLQSYILTAGYSAHRACSRSTFST